MLEFKSKGHKVLSLTQTGGEHFNPFLQENGIEAYSYVAKAQIDVLYYIRNLLYFVNFCRTKKVDVVFSHLESANFVASIGQYLIGSEVFLCRHHIDEAALYKTDRHWSYRLTNLLAKKIIVVSQRALEYVNKVEKIPRRKLIHINLAYDFSLYNVQSADVIQAMRLKYNTDMLLVTLCRLTKFKRPELSIQVLEKLLARGINAKLIILGTGDMAKELNEYVVKENLAGSVFLPGHVCNAMDYLQAADVVIHPSILESSCVVVKEAGLQKKPVVVCRNIGDFDDYLVHGQNAFLVDKDNFVNETFGILTTVDKTDLQKAGSNLFNDIHRLFAVHNVISRYEPLLKC